MVRLPERPLFTQTYTAAHPISLDTPCAVIVGSPGEDRTGQSAAAIATDDSSARRVLVTDQTPGDFEVRFDNVARRVPLWSLSEIEALLQALERPLIYLDITGLEHAVWAPLVKVGCSLPIDFRVIYTEPENYTYSPSPAQNDFFDLSERIRGISPIPTFASLSFTDDGALFVPMLGFEGARLAFMLEQVQPSRGRLLPVIGVPGFRAEYPFHTYFSNKNSLLQSGAWRDAYLAKANCPFSAYYALTTILDRRAMGHRMRIAPIGTKPHALGAVLFCLAHPDMTELVYDHPVRKSSRTSGAYRTLLYHVSRLVGYQSTQS